MVQTQSVGLIDVGGSFAVPVEFNLFNPAVGRLNSVTLGLTGSFSGSVGVENVSNTPDVANGIIAGSVTVAAGDNALGAEVFPDAASATHHLTAFDGKLDYAGTSGFSDAVSGAAVSSSVTAPPPASALRLFAGTG